MTFLIYKITCNINNKCYIGKTNDLDARIKQHRIKAKNNRQPSYIHNAITKHGFDNFKIEVLLDNIENEDVAYNIEAAYISNYQSNNPDFGYNISPGGRGVMSNMTHTKKGRDKISQMQKGMPARRDDYDVSDETRIKLSEISKNNKGKIPLEVKMEVLNLYNSCQYTKQQIADKLGLRYEAVRFITIFYKKYGFRTEEEKTENRIKGRAHLKNVPLSDEHKAKVSASLKGHDVSLETRANLSRALTGKTVPQEVRDKIAITLSGDPDYPAKRDKIVSLYETGMTQKQICIELNLPAKIVGSVITRYRYRRQ